MTWVLVPHRAMGRFGQMGLPLALAYRAHVQSPHPWRPRRETRELPKVVLEANAPREVLSLPGPSREHTELHAGGNHVGSATTVDTEYAQGSN